MRDRTAVLCGCLALLLAWLVGSTAALLPTLCVLSLLSHAAEYAVVALLLSLLSAIPTEVRLLAASLGALAAALLAAQAGWDRATRPRLPPEPAPA